MFLWSEDSSKSFWWVEGAVDSLQRKEGQPQCGQLLQVSEMTSCWGVYEEFSEGVFNSSEPVPSMAHLGQEQCFHCWFLYFTKCHFLHFSGIYSLIWYSRLGEPMHANSKERGTSIVLQSLMVSEVMVITSIWGHTEMGVARGIIYQNLCPLCLFCTLSSPTPSMVVQCL